MAVTPLTITTLSSGILTGLDSVTWTAADPTNFNSFTFTGREVLLARNDSADTARTATVVSTPDGLGRTGDIVQSLAFGTTRAIKLPADGVGFSGGAPKIVTVKGSTNDIKFAVLRLPN